MVGFVIVSHSKSLASEVIKLCNEMKKHDFKVVNGSGMESNDALGSDPMIIEKAIERVYSKDGVLILGDIGSSILNSEMAIELLPPEYDRNLIKIADAPLVEGTLVAMAINDGKTTLSEIVEELSEFRSFSKLN